MCRQGKFSMWLSDFSREAGESEGMGSKEVSGEGGLCIELYLGADAKLQGLCVEDQEVNPNPLLFKC